MISFVIDHTFLIYMCLVYMFCIQKLTICLAILSSMEHSKISLQSLDQEGHGHHGDADQALSSKISPMRAFTSLSEHI